MIDKQNNIWTIAGDFPIGQWVRENASLNWVPHEHSIIGGLLYIRGGFRTVIDIGAFIGDYTVIYADKFDHVHAFEPQPEAFECMVHNVEQFNNVTCYNAAIGNPDTSYKIAYNESNLGATSMVPDENGIKFITMPDIRDVDFIKIDVEGSELDVLDQCEEIIKRDHPALQIEQIGALGTESAVREFLTKHGYTWQVVSGQEPIQYELFCT